MDLRVKASEARAAAVKLAAAAEAIRDRRDSPDCRDRGGVVTALLGRAAVMDQQAQVLEAAGRRRS
jgi:hypothetical protein